MQEDTPTKASCPCLDNSWQAEEELEKKKQRIKDRQRYWIKQMAKQREFISSKIGRSLSNYFSDLGISDKI